MTSTKYLEKQPGKFVGDTACEKLPVEICGAGCVLEEGEEECHDKVLASIVDVPEEVCDLNPQKTCRYVTKLVPSLSPEHQCTIVPKETCILKFSQPEQVTITDISLELSKSYIQFTGCPAAADQVVSRPHGGCPRGELRRGERPGRAPGGGGDRGGE